MRSIPKSWLLAAALVLSAALGAPTPSLAQIPDEFTNLKVLPKDISKQELIGTMKGFAIGLGVRCWYCHKGEGDDFSTFDFASDEKKTKQAARLMLEMVRTINADFVSKVPHEETGSGHGQHVTVTCMTCHRGQPKPTLED